MRILRQTVVSLAISIVITALANFVIYLITGSFSLSGFIFFGLFFGLSWPFYRRFNSSKKNQ